MDREITLSSYDVKGQGNNTTQNFTTKFNRPIMLDGNYQYVVGLNKIINMTFTWFNVTPLYNNQLIKYSSDSGSTFEEITFPAGVWVYKRLDAYIKDMTKIVKDDANKDDNNKYDYPITLKFNEATLKVMVMLAKNYQLDLTASNFNDLIGFEKVVLKNEINMGSYVPNLSQDTGILHIHCDLINESLVDGQETDIIYSFSTGVLNPSSSFSIEPMRVTYNPTNKNIIDSIRIYITDGKKKIN